MNLNQVTLVFLKVLSVFLEYPNQKFCGMDIMKKLKLRSGTVYPLLVKMETAGWLKREFEEVDPKVVKRPAKILYQISPSGIRAGDKLVKENSLALGAILTEDGRRVTNLITEAS